MLQCGDMDERLLKPYEHKETEPRIYKMWEESGFFAPEAHQFQAGSLNNLKANEAKSFCIIMPPPNANGHLHAGHGLVVAIEDIITRYKRMRGYKTLWLPGADHAGFETQVVYEKELERQGRSRFGMNLKQLYDDIMAFTLENKKHMGSEIRELGASCDWSREKFTLDGDIKKTVYKTFKRLGDDGLLYRGKRIVNWCTKHQTAFSDLEVEHAEQKDPLYYMKYGPFTLATVRPETKFGDTAVAVNPTDERYKNYIGKEIEIDTLTAKVKLKVIADSSVDMSFGTGVVKVTPAHDSNDYEIGLRHNLEVREVIDQFGKLNERCGKYAGLSVAEARLKIAEDLKNAGLMDKVDENYTHAVATCYKCGRVLEPRVMPQWFIKMESLAKPAIEAIEGGDVRFIPEHYKKISLHWLSNIKDWNISRQIVWGIAIPAKLCLKCEHAMVDIEDKVAKCEKCGGKMSPDPDTFDTWFSSGQWPFAALGYPDREDYKTFYPTDVMETAGEIIFFWVNRMIVLGLYVTGKVPFKTVYLHGLVLDEKGRKMSKSKGNVINPLEITGKYGTDAFRMALVVGNTPGTSLALSPEKVKAYKHFANKLWNIGRFIYENCEDIVLGEKPKLEETDEEYIIELDKLAADVTEDMEGFRFYLAAEKLYHYIWHTFADKIIEESKAILKNKDAIAKTSRAWTLLQVFTHCLRMLHPFMPFITEELWSLLKVEDKNPIIIAQWPISRN